MPRHPPGRSWWTVVATVGDRVITASDVLLETHLPNVIPVRFPRSSSGGSTHWTH